jgi:hypothetical protein
MLTSDILPSIPVSAPLVVNDNEENTNDIFGDTSDDDVEIIDPIVRSTADKEQVLVRLVEDMMSERSTMKVAPKRKAVYKKIERRTLKQKTLAMIKASKHMFQEIKLKRIPRSAGTLFLNFFNTF